jgi:alkylation response protein AidB-like acyl-CoA dehydrogenase
LTPHVFRGTLASLSGDGLATAGSERGKMEQANVCARPTGPTPRIDVTPIVDAVRPVIVESLDELEQRRIPAALVDALYESGVLRALLPLEHGGLEMHPLDWMDLTYEIARLNGSVAWLSVISTGATMLLDPETMTEMAASSRMLHAGSAGRIGSAMKVEGGYHVSGRWNFASGSPFADFLAATVYLVDENDEPILDDSGEPTLLEAHIDADQATRFDNWDGLGLRGTGSDDFAVDHLFVPESRVNVWGVFAEPYASRPLYKYMFQQMGHATVGLGLARAAIDTFIELANRPPRRDSSRQSMLGKHQIDKIAIAKADSLVRSARLFAWESAGRVYEDACAGRALADDAINLMRQSNIHAVHAAREAMTLIYRRASVDGVLRGNKLEVQFRDLMTASQHVSTGEDQLAPIGHFILHAEPDGSPTIAVSVGLSAAAAAAEGA